MLKFWQDNRALCAQAALLQHAVEDILTAQSAATSSVGNPYPNDTAQVAELSKKYEGKADWGNQVNRNVIDVRAAFTMGGGATPVVKEGVTGGDRELGFIQEFIERNDLDEEAA
jgi:hypothetical protein